MNRRDTIKSLLIGSVATGFAFKGCSPTTDTKALPELVESPLYGRTESEKLRDEKLFSTTFFNEHELATMAILCDIILPKTDQYPAATEVDVTAFIEFIVKDMEEHQVPIRGGLMWLDGFSIKIYSKEFVSCTEEERLYICDQIAYPKNTDPELIQGEAFFSRMRDLTLTGYYTSKEGIEAIGYKGNTPNVWDGVPEDVLEEHGLEYDTEWLAKCVNESNRSGIAKWDDDGNLIS